MPEDLRLDEFTKEEWWDIIIDVKPDITRFEYEKIWAGFVALKEKKKLQ